MQLTGIERDTTIKAPSIQLEFEMRYRFEFSTSLLKRAARCAPFAAAIWAAPAAMAQTVAPNSSTMQAMPAQRVVIDQFTGSVRMAEPNEVQGASQAPAGAVSKAEATSVEAHPGMKRLQAAKSQPQLGAGMRRLDASSMQFSVVKRDADGKLSTECVHGDQAAHDAVHSKTTGVRHDH